MKRAGFRYNILQSILLTLLFVISASFSYIYFISGSGSENVKLNNYPVITFASPTPKEEKNVRVVLTGDIMLGRSVMTEALVRGDPFFPFRKVADFLRAADITFVNLENPIIKNCQKHEGGFTFCTTYEIAEGLTFSGIDVVSLANNHSLNYGRKGLDETVDYLESKDILVTGVGELATKEVNGTTFGFLGFDRAQQGEPKLEAGEVELIKESDGKVDILIIGMHWGVEYQNKALPGVRSMALNLIKNGADVVVGHHPHWVQDSETINGVPVYYSLGNFIFDQMWSEETKKGEVVELTLRDKKIVGEKFYKTYIRQKGQPEFVE